MARPALALCMIVRNEARFLEGALRSVEGVADQLVVVDTGSIDGTREIARAHRATVVDFPWCDDFAAARNAALPLVEAPWILQLDADERLAPGSGPRLLAAIRQGGFLCGLLSLHNAARLDVDPADVLSGAARLGRPIALARLFRNVDGLAWESCVHEHVGGWLDRTGFQVRRLDVELLHLGAVEELRQARGKQERNRRLLERRCRLEPHDAVARGYLAHELLRAGEHEQARQVAEAGWALVRRTPGTRSVTRLAVVRAALAGMAHEPHVVLETAALAASLGGPNPELSYLEGLAHASLAESTPTDDDLRRVHLSHALAAFRVARSMEDATEEPVLGLHTRALGWLQEALAALQLGAVDEASLALEHALKDGVDGREVALGQVELALRSGDPARAMGQVVPLLDGGPDGWLLAALAAESVGATADAVRLLQRALQSSGTWAAAHRRREGLELIRRLGSAPAATRPHA